MMFSVTRGPGKAGPTAAESGSEEAAREGVVSTTLGTGDTTTTGRGGTTTTQH